MTEKCKRCHRILKNPASVNHGYGPTCWKKHQIAIDMQIEKDLRKMNENVYTNEQHMNNKEVM